MGSYDFIIALCLCAWNLIKHVLAFESCFFSSEQCRIDSLTCQHSTEFLPRDIENLFLPHRDLSGTCECPEITSQNLYTCGDMPPTNTCGDMPPNTNTCGDMPPYTNTCGDMPPKTINFVGNMPFSKRHKVRFKGKRKPHHNGHNNIPETPWPLVPAKQQLDWEALFCGFPPPLNTISVKQLMVSETHNTGRVFPSDIGSSMEHLTCSNTDCGILSSPVNTLFSAEQLVWEANLTAFQRAIEAGFNELMPVDTILPVGQLVCSKKAHMSGLIIKSQEQLSSDANFRELELVLNEDYHRGLLSPVSVVPSEQQSLTSKGSSPFQLPHLINGLSLLTPSVFSDQQSVQEHLINGLSLLTPSVVSDQQPVQESHISDLSPPKPSDVSDQQSVQETHLSGLSPPEPSDISDQQPVRELHFSGLSQPVAIDISDQQPVQETHLSGLSPPVATDISDQQPVQESHLSGLSQCQSEPGEQCRSHHVYSTVRQSGLALQYKAHCMLSALSQSESAVQSPSCDIHSVPVRAWVAAQSVCCALSAQPVGIALSGEQQLATESHHRVLSQPVGIALSEEQPLGTESHHRELSQPVGIALSGEQQLGTESHHRKLSQPVGIALSEEQQLGTESHHRELSQPVGIALSEEQPGTGSHYREHQLICMKLHPDELSQSTDSDAAAAAAAAAQESHLSCLSQPVVDIVLTDEPHLIQESPHRGFPSLDDIVFSKKQLVQSYLSHLSPSIDIDSLEPQLMQQEFSFSGPSVDSNSSEQQPVQELHLSGLSSPVSPSFLHPITGITFREPLLVVGSYYRSLSLLIDVSPEQYVELDLHSLLGIPHREQQMVMPTRSTLGSLCWLARSLNPTLCYLVSSVAVLVGAWTTAQSVLRVLCAVSVRAWGAAESALCSVCKEPLRAWGAAESVIRSLSAVPAGAWGAAQQSRSRDICAVSVRAWGAAERVVRSFSAVPAGACWEAAQQNTSCVVNASSVRAWEAVYSALGVLITVVCWGAAESGLRAHTASPDRVWGVMLNINIF